MIRFAFLFFCLFFTVSIIELYQYHLNWRKCVDRRLKRVWKKLNDKHIFSGAQLWDNSRMAPHKPNSATQFLAVKMLFRPFQMLLQISALPLFKKIINRLWTNSICFYSIFTKFVYFSANFVQSFCFLNACKYFYKFNVWIFF